MRTKLNTFSDFTNTLFPHEVDYLLSVQQFSKKENINILLQIHQNCHSAQKTAHFNPNIDKRTYSYLKNWITDSLNKIDVDRYFEWLIETEKEVMTDSVSPEVEDRILANIKEINPKHYYFLRFYELMQHYRDYLLVRNRSRYYRVVSEFLNQHKELYFQRMAINQRLNLATIQIIQKEEFIDAEFANSEDFFRSLYFNDDLDGYTRYRAVVRLTIYFYNTRQFDKLQQVYHHLDEQFKTPLFYSKRILANYYANRAMMHSKLNELTLAEKYGYLSIQNKNSDYLFYLINLCGVLLKQGKKIEALTIMNASIPELKKTNSFYYKIGFVAFYIRTLMLNEQFEKAVNYASGFFDAYKKEIFDHRWHLFFSVYLQALIRAEKYAKVLSLCHRYKLVSKEKIHIGKAVYLPVIQWYSHLAEYIEGVISQEKLITSIVKSSQNLMENKYRSRKIMELLDELSFNLPSEIKIIKENILSLSIQTQ